MLMVSLFPFTTPRTAFLMMRTIEDQSPRSRPRMVAGPAADCSAALSEVAESANTRARTRTDDFLNMTPPSPEWDVQVLEERSSTLIGVILTPVSLRARIAAGRRCTIPHI